jgi:hypothetical protein
MHRYNNDISLVHPDTITMMAQYTDLLVLRSPSRDACLQAQRVLNAMASFTINYYSNYQMHISCIHITV